MRLSLSAAVLALLCLACRASAADALPGVYQQYKPAATPTPVQDPGVARVTMHKDSVSVALKGGLASRMGDEAKFHTAGAGGGLDLIFQVSPELAAAFYLGFSSVPYSLTTAAQPMSSFGVGIKAIYDLFEMEGVKGFLMGGMGYQVSSRATQQLISVDPVTALPKFETKYQQAGGMAFVGGFGFKYNFTPNFGITGEAAATSVSLAGGTGDSVLLFHPAAGIIYTF